MIKAIEKIGRRNIISCVAASHHKRKPHCLDLKTAIGVLEESKSAALIYNIPLRKAHALDKQTIKWTFLELVQKLRNVKDYCIMANTSRARTINDAYEMSMRNIECYDSISSKCGFQEMPIIKLEILDNELKSKDSDVIALTGEMIERNSMTIIPMVNPDIKSILELNELDVPMIRVLSGKIGQQSGIINRRLVQNAILESKKPIILEGGLRNTNDIIESFQIGATAVLVNTAYRKAKDPVLLAKKLRFDIDNYIKMEGKDE